MSLAFEAKNARALGLRALSLSALLTTLVVRQVWTITTKIDAWQQII